MIGLSIGEVPVPPATGHDILLNSDGKIQMQYIVSDTDSGVGVVQEEPWVLL